MRQNVSWIIGAILVCCLGEQEHRWEGGGPMKDVGSHAQTGDQASRPEVEEGLQGGTDLPRCKHRYQTLVTGLKNDTRITGGRKVLIKTAS